MKKECLVLSIVILLLSYACLGQSPYEVSWKKEIPYISTGIGVIALGAYTQTLPKLFTTDELTSLDPNDINSLDRLAVKNFSDRADKASDVFWIGSHAFPLLFLGGKETRSHFGQIMTLYGEAAVINFGLTVISKNITQRPRPYVFNPEISNSYKKNHGAKASLVSGHTSMAAVNSFFMAKVFSDFYPESKWKPVVWGTAILIPGITGYLRVEAGRHYPTDVIAGYVLGAAVGILVPHFHRHNKLLEKRITFQAGLNSVYFAWSFNQ